MAFLRAGSPGNLPGGAADSRLNYGEVDTIEFHNFLPGLLPGGRCNGRPSRNNITNLLFQLRLY